MGTFSVQWDSFQQIIDGYKDAAWMRLGIFVGSQAMVVYMQRAWSKAFSNEALNKYVNSVQAKRVKAVIMLHINSVFPHSESIFSRRL